MVVRARRPGLAQPRQVGRVVGGLESGQRGVLHHDHDDVREPGDPGRREAHGGSVRRPAGEARGARAALIPNTTRRTRPWRPARDDGLSRPSPARAYLSTSGHGPLPARHSCNGRVDGGFLVLDAYTVAFERCGSPSARGRVQRLVERLRSWACRRRRDAPDVRPHGQRGRHDLRDARPFHRGHRDAALGGAIRPGDGPQPCGLQPRLHHAGHLFRSRPERRSGRPHGSHRRGRLLHRRRVVRVLEAADEQRGLRVGRGDLVGVRPRPQPGAPDRRSESPDGLRRTRRAGRSDRS